LAEKEKGLQAVKLTACGTFLAKLPIFAIITNSYTIKLNIAFPNPKRPVILF